MTPSIRIEIELNTDGYDRLCRVTEEFHKAGSTADLGTVVALALQTGTEALEALCRKAAVERAIGNPAESRLN